MLKRMHSSAPAHHFGTVRKLMARFYLSMFATERGQTVHYSVAQGIILAREMLNSLIFAGNRRIPPYGAYILS